MNFDKICQKFNRREENAPVITLPEIFGYENKEVFITKWLAYLLDAEKNGFGKAPLNVLLELAGADSVPEHHKVRIIREYHFSETGIIDILIETPDTFIGLENKLWSDETQTNGKPQTAVYYSNLKKTARKKKKNLICIFLKPQANSTIPACSEFRIVTYTELISAWKQILQEIHEESRKKFLFSEFILYVEEKLMDKNHKKFPVFSHNARIYQQYLSEIKKAEQEYKCYLSSFDAWFINTFLALAEDFQISTSSNTLEKQLKNGSLQIVRKKEWEELEFYFAIVWESDSRLYASEYIWVEAHCDGNQSNAKYLKQNFKKMGFSVKNGVLCCSEKIKPDFSNETTALQTVKAVKEILVFEPFQQCTQIAEEFWLKWLK